jgi:spermidine/putrescine-binding protein
MLSKFQNSADGTYDILNPSDYMVEYMKDEGLLAELDKDILTNYDNLDEQYMGQFYDEDNTYSVPFAPGIVNIAYDSSVIKDDITKLSTYLTIVQIISCHLDDPKIIVGMVNKCLGYSLKIR